MLKKLNKLHYIAFSGKYLFLTNLVLSFVLTGTGDVLAQHFQLIQGNSTQWDKLRTCKMAATGIPMGAFCHTYYKILDKQFPGASTKSVVKKVIVDQTICGPLGMLIFIISITCMEGFTAEALSNNVKQNWGRLIMGDLVVWPVAQLINFSMLRPKFRVLYDNMISLGCYVYRSHVHFDS